jgi:hypothetical protein
LSSELAPTLLFDKYEEEVWGKIRKTIIRIIMGVLEFALEDLQGEIYLMK